MIREGVPKNGPQIVGRGITVENRLKLWVMVGNFRDKMGPPPSPQWGLNCCGSYFFAKGLLVPWSPRIASHLFLCPLVTLSGQNRGLSYSLVEKGSCLPMNGHWWKGTKTVYPNLPCVREKLPPEEIVTYACMSVLSRDGPHQTLARWLHPKLRNINPCNVTHSLISQNLRERIFVVQILFLIVKFFSLISQVFAIDVKHHRGQPTPRIAPCVNMWSVFFFFVWCCCHLLNCWCMDMSHCSGRPSGRLKCEGGSRVMIP